MIQILRDIFESMFQIPGEIIESEARGMWALEQLRRGYIE